jgi:hypothetical protein
MKDFSWPVLLLAVIMLFAGAIVGDALRASAGGSVQMLARTSP